MRIEDGAAGAEAELSTNVRQRTGSSDTTIWPKDLRNSVRRRCSTMQAATPARLHSASAPPMALPVTAAGVMRDEAAFATSSASMGVRLGEGDDDSARALDVVAMRL